MSRIHPKDLERKLREIESEVEDVAVVAKPAGLAVGVGVLTVAVGSAYILGQRKARKQTTIVEVRRV
jgi:hypothetical protein